jgi:hypothetical protein
VVARVLHVQSPVTAFSDADSVLASVFGFFFFFLFSFLFTVCLCNAQMLLDYLLA